MSNSIRRAEATLNNFELKIAGDYGSTRDRHPGDVGQEIPGAPESVGENILEGGEQFEQGRDNAHAFAEDEELNQAEDYFEQAFESYETAVDEHLDYSEFEDLVDVDLVIDEAVDGRIDEEAVVEAAGLQTFVVDDLQSDQSHVRRNMDDDDAYQFLEESEYDTETVVRDNYMQELDQAQQYVDEGLEEIRESPGL